MNLILLTAGPEGTARAGYSQIEALLFLLIGVLALLCALLFARFRIAASAVFWRPFRERTIIAKSGNRFYLYVEDEPPNPDGNDDHPKPDNPENPDGPDRSGLGNPATRPRVASAKPGRPETGRRERGRGH